MLALTSSLHAAAAKGLAQPAARRRRGGRLPRVRSTPDKRSGDPEHGGLTSGEKSAVTREVHGEARVHFTEPGHPEKAEAAQQWAKEVREDERHGVQHGHHEAAQAAHKKAGKNGGGAHGADEELSTGEKAAVSRAVHDGRDLNTLPFIRRASHKVEAAREYAREVKPKGEH